MWHGCSRKEALTLQQSFAGRLDLSRTVLGGHSFGGATVLSAAAQNSVIPIKAVFALGITHGTTAYRIAIIIINIFWIFINQIRPMVGFQESLVRSSALDLKVIRVLLLHWLRVSIWYRSRCCHYLVKHGLISTGTIQWWKLFAAARHRTTLSPAFWVSAVKKNGKIILL